MYLLFTDETNTSPQYDARIKFFAYGGLIIPFDSLSELDNGIQKIRMEAGYEPANSLKFDTHSKPEHVSPEQFAKIKNDIISLCIETKCKFLVYVVLHKIAENQGINQTIKWGADHIVGKFNYFLKRNNSTGFVIMDRLPDTNEYSFFTEKFTKGLVFSNKNIPLENIRMFSSSCDNASNFNSAMDIVLGSFRYCINAPQNWGSAQKMMHNVVSLIWAERQDDHIIDPFEKGLTFRPNPEKIEVEEYKEEYTNLLKFINSLLKG